MSVQSPGIEKVNDDLNRYIKNGILIVDDSKFSRNILKDMLEKEGYIIAGEAGDGLEAVDQALHLLPEVIFMDVTMPKLDGLGAVERILDKEPDIHIVMCTAMGQNTFISEAVKLGAKDYVIKPYKSDNIIGVLNSYNDMMKHAEQAKEEEARLKEEEEARLKAEEEEAKLKAEEEARLKAEEEARLKAKEEARLKAEEEARLKAEEEAKLKAEEEARLKAEEEEMRASEARKRAEETKRKAEEARIKAEERAKRREEEIRLKEEEEARKLAEEAAEMDRAVEEARKLAEEARFKAEEEERLKAEEEAKINAAKEEEERLRLKAEEEAKLKAEEEARLKAEEEKARKAKEAYDIMPRLIEGYEEEYSLPSLDFSLIEDETTSENDDEQLELNFSENAIPLFADYLIKKDDKKDILPILEETEEANLPSLPSEESEDAIEIAEELQSIDGMAASAENLYQMENLEDIEEEEQILGEIAASVEDLDQLYSLEDIDSEEEEEQILGEIAASVEEVDEISASKEDIEDAEINAILNDIIEEVAGDVGEMFDELVALDAIDDAIEDLEEVEEMEPEEIVGEKFKILFNGERLRELIHIDSKNLETQPQEEIIEDIDNKPIFTLTYEYLWRDRFESYDENFKIHKHICNTKLGLLLHESKNLESDVEIQVDYKNLMLYGLIDTFDPNGLRFAKNEIDIRPRKPLGDKKLYSKTYNKSITNEICIANIKDKNKTSESNNIKSKTSSINNIFSEFINENKINLS